MKKHIFLALLGIGVSINCFSEETKPQLKDFRKNVYSQWGEDGIIEKIFETIGVTSKVCIEFGAWDGFHLSNTAKLWAEDNWEGILIELDEERFLGLVENTKEYNCICLNKAVGFTKDDSLERILEDIHYTKDVDLLSIDIDGDDYYIFKSLKTLRPRVVICEHNPTMPAHLDIYSMPGSYSGCSVGALNRIASIHGYTLVSITETNCFYVRNDEIHKFSDYDLALDSMRIDTYVKYVVTDYAGHYKIVGNKDSKTAYGFYAQTTFLMDGDVKIYDDNL